MRANRRVDTGPERRLRSALHRAGLRFYKDAPIEAGEVRVRVDIVFPKQAVAVFVDGCFWHSCAQHGKMPARNQEYWQKKLKRNAERDKMVDAALSEAGWSVVRVWEHEAIDDAVSTVCEALKLVN